jgi:hypothetical protein
MRKHVFCFVIVIALLTLLRHGDARSDSREAAYSQRIGDFIAALNKAVATMTVEELCVRVECNKNTQAGNIVKSALKEKLKAEAMPALLERFAGNGEYTQEIVADTIASRGDATYEELTRVMLCPRTSAVAKRRLLDTFKGMLSEEPTATIVAYQEKIPGGDALYEILALRDDYPLETLVVKMNSTSNPFGVHGPFMARLEKADTPTLTKIGVESERAWVVGTVTSILVEREDASNDDIFRLMAKLEEWGPAVGAPCGREFLKTLSARPNLSIDHKIKILVWEEKSFR